MNPKYSPTPSAPAEESYPGGVTESSGTMTEAKNKVSQTAREAAAKMKDAAGGTVTRAKEQASRFAAEKKEKTLIDYIDADLKAIDKELIKIFTIPKK